MIFHDFFRSFFFSIWKVVVIFAGIVNLEVFERKKECFVEKTPRSWDI